MIAAVKGAGGALRRSVPRRGRDEDEERIQKHSRDTLHPRARPRPRPRPSAAVAAPPHPLPRPPPPHPEASPESGRPLLRQSKGAAKPSDRAQSWACWTRLLERGSSGNNLPPTIARERPRSTSEMRAPLDSRERHGIEALQ